MTDLNPTVKDDDFIDDTDRQQARPDGEDDRWIEDGPDRVGAEDRIFARESGLREAVLSDLETGRDWARERAFVAKARISDKPLKATAYALGIGVLIGLLLRR